MPVDVLKLLDGVPEIPDVPMDPALLAALTPSGGGIVEELRTAHHLLAKTLAEGHDPQTAAARCGMTIARVKRMLDDPTFQELLEYYQSQRDELFAHVKDRLAAMGLTFMDVLQERLMDAPEKFTNKELMEFGDRLLEKTVAPSTTKGPALTANPIAISINFVKPEQPQHAELELRALPVDPLKDLA